MLFILSAFLATAFGQGDECLDANNMPALGVNAECNLAGTCIERACYCCELDEKTLRPTTFDNVPDCPNWRGGLYSNGAQGPCTSQTEFASVTFKYYFPESQNFDCSNTVRREEILQAIISFYGAHAYDGKIVEVACTDCTPGEPCRFYDLDDSSQYDDYTDGVEFSVGTDFHTYYDMACFNPDDPIPSIYNQARCPENYDQGYLAYMAFKRAKFYNPSEPDEWNSGGTSDFEAVNADTSSGITASNFEVILNKKEVSIRTLSPTPAPTPVPSNMCFDLGYTNKPTDLKYMGNGKNCRDGIKRTWPGGRTCDSPYIVCLPEENTPEQYPKDPFYDNTHLYTVDQCNYECTWDQRCRGFEFVATSGNTGLCNLIDDLPLVIQEPGSYVYDPSHQSLMTGELANKPALCFQKEDYCNPYFEAEDLSQTMLDCYCPNNRKGFYTKKVKRTVENTRFCQSDSADDAATTERIKHAQANRMFHLCENWCLFNTFQPEQESWYWNPWQKCWREQYAGTGTHRSYCNRVIRNPDTIEQYFISYRQNTFCAPHSMPPTGQPSEFATRWYIAQQEQSCSAACFERGEVCSEAMTASLGETSTDDEVNDAFLEAGITCSSIAVAEEDWAAPYLKSNNQRCFKRNDLTEANTGCNWAVGEGYQRLCACTESPSD